MTSDQQPENLCSSWGLCCCWCWCVGVTCDMWKMNLNFFSFFLNMVIFFVYSGTTILTLTRLSKMCQRFKQYLRKQILVMPFFWKVKIQIVLYSSLQIQEGLIQKYRIECRECIIGALWDVWCAMCRSKYALSSGLEERVQGCNIGEMCVCSSFPPLFRLYKKKFCGNSSAKPELKIVKTS